MATKRPLFNRPAWASAPAPVSAGSKTNPFGRQNVYEDILELERQRKEKREEKSKSRSRNRAGKDKEGKQEGNSAPAPKKRRVSKEVEDYTSDSETSTRSTHSKEERTPEPQSHKPVLRNTPKRKGELAAGIEELSPRRSSTGRLPKNTAVIQLDDEDEDESKLNPLESNNEAFAANATAKKPESQSESEEEDEYLRELKQKAREKARLQRLGLGNERAASSASPSADFRSPSIEAGRAALVMSQPDVSASNAPDPPPSRPEEPKVPDVRILITSAIPNTKPLVVERHSSQTLQKVKEYYVQRFKLEPALASSVFFTWRGTRLYNSSTTRSLISILKHERGLHPDDEYDPSNGQIALEIVTQELFDEQQKASARQAPTAQAENHDNAHVESGTTNDQNNADETKTLAPVKAIILQLQSKNLEAMPLRVRPHTLVGKIMHAFKQHRQVEADKTCWLIFDGERLDPNLSVEDVGFENGDEVEVHPR